ncbi:MAG: C25 family cysteine peptidase [Lentimicrobiaceae bacterium]|nr:C25 family cysteine peptidase [Lentimicrobiaceae bacterium]
MKPLNKHYFLLFFVIFLFIPLSLFPQWREKMIIVSPMLFSTQLDAYIAEKEADNVDCRLIVVDSGESFQAVKQKITNLYAEFNADFLLLVGDFEHIPSFPVEEGLSDMQYGILSDDSTPEMAVGRFSVETAEHLQTMMQRSLVYKNCSKTVVGIASKQRSELTQLTDFEQVGQLNAFLETKGFHIAAELFAGVNETNPTYQDVQNVLNQGVTWVNYAGNGSYYGWNTSGFSNHHIDSLSNSGELPIILSAACLNGYFAQRECFAEKWLRAVSNGKPIGARAVVMSSVLADWDATLLGMRLMCENLPTSDDNCRLGTLYLQGYQYIANELKRKKEAQCWLLFGDPSLWIYPPAETPIKEPHLTAQPDFLYPNPTTGKFSVFSFQFSEMSGEVEIYDVVGRKYNVGAKHILPNEEIEIDISHLANGLYFLKIDGKTVKVVKQ